MSHGSVSVLESRLGGADVVFIFLLLSDNEWMIKYQAALDG